MESTDPTEKNWDKEWRNYNQSPYFKPNRRVINIVAECFNGNVKNKKIMELGAGSGCDILSLVKKGVEGYALDFSAESIKTVKLWAKKMKCKITSIKGDIKKVPYGDNYFDMVYSVGLMEHFKGLIPLLKEQIRIVKPGGFLMIDVPQKFTLYTIAKHVRMKLDTHPFGWETEFSKNDLVKLAHQLNQPVHLIYGRDSDIISRLPSFLKKRTQQFFAMTLEKTRIAPYISLCIGIVIKVKK